MQELYTAMLVMPWKFWVLMGTVVVLCCYAIWFSSRKSVDFNGQFYDRWMKRINGELKLCRKVKRRNGNRKAAYTNAFTRLIDDLTAETGGMANYMNLPIAQRGVWIYLLTRIRDVQYFD